MLAQVAGVAVAVRLGLAQAGLDRHRQRALPSLRGDGQGDGGAVQGDARVGADVVGREADDRRDERGEQRTVGVGGPVVDVAGDLGQQRVRAGRVVAPPLAGEEGRQLHEAGAASRVAVLAAREHRQQVRDRGGVTCARPPAVSRCPQCAVRRAVREERARGRQVTVRAHRSPPCAAGPRMTGMRIVVAGASGFVGRRLCPALEEAGHEVVAMTRHPDRYPGAGTPVRGDVHDAGSLAAALAGLRRRLLPGALARRRRLQAQRTPRPRGPSPRPRRGAGLRRIVYLGGLGDDADDLSAHLRSRREVEKLLGGGGVPVTTLRAGIIVGHGGISWEMTRQLVEHLPAMITPRWVRTRTQPIAVADVVRYLVGVLEVPEATGRALRHRRPGGPGVRRDAAPGRRHRGPHAARSCRCRCSRPRCRRAGCRW